MKIIVREKADADLDAIFAWIAKDNPAAAVAMIRRIRQRIGRLATPGLENMGRPGLDVGTRELIEPPYIIVYEALSGVSLCRNSFCTTSGTNILSNRAGRISTCSIQTR
jgi:plasmid stabilization system protein ParE